MYLKIIVYGCIDKLTVIKHQTNRINMNLTFRRKNRIDKKRSEQVMAKESCITDMKMRSLSLQNVKNSLKVEPPNKMILQ